VATGALETIKCATINPIEKEASGITQNQFFLKNMVYLSSAVSQPTPPVLKQVVTAPTKPKMPIINPSFKTSKSAP